MDFLNDFQSVNLSSTIGSVGMASGNPIGIAAGAVLSGLGATADLVENNDTNDLGIYKDWRKSARRKSIAGAMRNPIMANPLLFNLSMANNAKTYKKEYEKQLDMATGNMMNKSGLGFNTLNKSLSFAEGGLINPLNVGGSHGMNPNGGVPIGMNPSGGSNLIEQGETFTGDFVFSDKNTITSDIVNKFKLPKNFIGKTFAEASKILNKPLEKDPGNAILKKGTEAMIDRLKMASMESLLASGMPIGGMPQEDQMFSGGGLTDKLLSIASRKGMSPVDPFEFNLLIDPNYAKGFAAGNSNLKGLVNDSSTINPPVLENLKYAPVAFNALGALATQLNKPKTYKAPLANTGRMSAHAFPREVDTEYMLGKLNKIGASTRRGLRETLASNPAALAAILSGTSAKLGGAAGDIMFNAENTNESRRVDARNFNADVTKTNLNQGNLMTQLNIGQKNREYDVNNANIARWQDLRSAYLQNLFGDAGKIGKEAYYSRQAKELAPLLASIGTTDPNFLKQLVALLQGMSKPGGN